MKVGLLVRILITGYWKMKSKFRIIKKTTIFHNDKFIYSVWYLYPRYITWNIKCECDGDTSDSDLRLIGDIVVIRVWSFKLNFPILCLYFLHTTLQNWKLCTYDKFIYLNCEKRRWDLQIILWISVCSQLRKFNCSVQQMESTPTTSKHTNYWRQLNILNIFALTN